MAEQLGEEGRDEDEEEVVRLEREIGELERLQSKHNL